MADRLDPSLGQTLRGPDRPSRAPAAGNSRLGRGLMTGSRGPPPAG